ncbi:MAG: hypothetical protein CMH63_03275 [Nanoarchaeota archaeon]|nr:hypothetical protein [Nanoarchaeota archaeon]|tara:strand:+ start:23808 stop:24023 length:216 start_codon:yes stop_codon:yes gene_type:complete
MVTKTKDIHIRFTRKQLERIKDNAESKGKSLSQYIRSLALENDTNLIYKVLEMRHMIKDLHSKLIKNDSKI